ncbi:hypothetical protein [Heyndrickxia oleronia]|jgi:hypothetical protein|uniref:hypothetical protein n=1 Tax=Heyndrickxia oleronia TaxID=38875 RepID=UPI00242ED16B|nr:hypothetical protein [Heyndrickxia oleronia]MCI1592466.1 hypothetical protein [Heyndrickxia oleronia]MCI1615427.1 hypothetical protein [Heyndrickxia oleronia]MCI1746281.1 hypothetical protein [Heyndrickxia oleronia]MCI1763606.1 hypothetical protein [Heyndrickxia oleronia]
MATLKIELDIDWLDEGESLDDVIKSKVITGLQDRLIQKAEQKVLAKIEREAEEKANEVVDSFIHGALEKKIDELKIPYKKNSWGSEVELIPISEFIGIRYEQYLTEKTLDENGREAKYSSDRKLSISEYFIKNYLAKELTSKVSMMIQTARKDAEETIVKALENNLKEQLSVDIIQRLNIPKMLESLQNKAAELETK